MNIHAHLILNQEKQDHSQISFNQFLTIIVVEIGK